jgi:hypothetical protein
MSSNKSRERELWTKLDKSEEELLNFKDYSGQLRVELEEKSRELDVANQQYGIYPSITN